MATNGVMIQFFHWYSPADGSLWREAAARAGELAAAGFTGVWLPPATKGIGGAADVGYGVYDLYDLGEFDQKGSVRTRYGTREEYLAAVRALQATGLQVYADAVLNHRLGGDDSELVQATPYAEHDRLTPAGEPRQVRAFTRFTFPGRRGKYSTFEWSWRHFDAVDHDALRPDEKGMIYLFEGKQFDDEVSLEKGNFAYLMGADLDFQFDEVRRELTDWGKWYLDATGVDGFRLDAVKHIPAWFFPDWLDEMRRHSGKDLFAVGEYWTADPAALHWYLDRLQGRMKLFAVPLHFRFHEAGQAGEGYDLCRLFENTLVASRETEVVTFVDNHDSQPLQALQSVVEAWFKPLAYAVILLRREGYPCVFYPDYYGAEYEDVGGDGNRHRIVLPSHRVLIDVFLRARRDHAYGDQLDYFDHASCVGWTRQGDADHPGGLAVLLSNGAAGVKWMDVGRPGARFVDLTGHVPEPVTTDDKGWGEFRCTAGSVSVWAPD